MAFVEDYDRHWPDLNAHNVAIAPAVAMGNYFLGTSAALVRAAQDATTTQHQTNVIALAATVRGVDHLYSRWRWVDPIIVI